LRQFTPSTDAYFASFDVGTTSSCIAIDSRSGNPAPLSGHATTGNLVLSGRCRCFSGHPSAWLSGATEVPVSTMPQRVGVVWVVCKSRVSVRRGGYTASAVYDIISLLFRSRTQGGTSYRAPQCGFAMKTNNVTLGTRPASCVLTNLVNDNMTSYTGTR